MEWKAIESCPAVGRKRWLFHLQNGAMMVGFRIAGSSLIVEPFSGKTFLAKAYCAIPQPSKGDP